MRKLLLAVLFCLAAFPALALDLGDPALEIHPLTWVTGEPADPTKVDGKTFYLVEVWSVTCPPCVQTIPIMNDIQKRYADQGLKIVSFTSDTEDEVKRFLQQHPMEYSSFIDKEGATIINYMAADNRNTIPHAFLFDKTGTLVWIGNPLDNLEMRVKQVISGQLNGDHAVKVKDAREKLQQSFNMQNVEGMLESLRELQTLEPENDQYYQVHYRILTDLGAGDDNDVKDLLTQWYKGSLNRPEGLVVLSMVAIDQGSPTQRNPQLALAAAKRAYDLDSELKAQAGLNLAETYKEVGRMDLALKTLDEVSALATDPEEQAMIREVKGFYLRIQEAGKNPDAPFNP